MLDTIDKFDTPDNLKEILENHKYFYCKKYMTSCETTFYVGTIVRFSGYKQNKMDDSHSYPLQCWVKDYVEWIDLDLALGFGKIRTIYKTLEDFLKDFEPLTEFNKKDYELKKENYWSYEVFGREVPSNNKSTMKNENESCWSKFKKLFI